MEAMGVSPNVISPLPAANLRGGSLSGGHACASTSSASSSQSSFLGNSLHKRAFVKQKRQHLDGTPSSSTTEMARCGQAPARNSCRNYSGESTSFNFSFRTPAWGAASERFRQTSLFESLVCQAQAPETVAARSPKKSDKNADQDNLNGQERLSKVFLLSLNTANCSLSSSG